MDMKQRQSEIGAYFRNIRTGLGLSLRDVAVPPLSYSQLSRFERGTSDISTDDAVRLMASLGLTRPDLRRMQAANSYSFPEELMNEAMVCDYGTINAQAQRFLDAHVDDPVTVMQEVERIILTCAAQDVKGDYQLGIVDEHTMLTFLMYPASWKATELSAIFVCAPFASDEFRNRCWERIERFDLESNVVEQNVQMLEGMLLATMKFGEWKSFSQHLPLLLHFTDDPDWDRQLRYTRVVTEFIKLVNLMQEGDAESGAKRVNELFRMIEEAGGVAMVPYLCNYWSFVQKPASQVHHRLAVNDEYAKEEPHGSASTYLTQVREERHLLMNQVALAWSPSAQTRFEKGENHFGFMRTDILKDFLLTDWGDISWESLSALEKAFTRFNQLAHADNLNQTTSAPVLQQLHEDLSIVPAKIAEIQEISAKLYSYGRAFDTVPRDIVNHGMTILRKQHIWTQRTYTLFLMCAGNASPDDAVEVWRSIIGANDHYTAPFKNIDLLDFYVSLSICGWDDSEVASNAARMMLEDLPHVQQEKWISLRTFYLQISRLLCEWTIERTRVKEDEVEHYLRLLIKLGYQTQVEFQIENFAIHFERPDFMADCLQ